MLATKAIYLYYRYIWTCYAVHNRIHRHFLKCNERINKYNIFCLNLALDV